MASCLLRSMLFRPVFKPSLTKTVCKRNFTRANYLLTKKYTEDHEWVLLSTDGKNIATIGITDYAQKALGEVVFVDLPDPDTEVTAGDVLGAVESVKSASDILSPVSGMVIEGNGALVQTPKLINQGAEDEGWICRVKVNDPAEVEGLMGSEGYEAYIKGGDT